VVCAEEKVVVVVGGEGALADWRWTAPGDCFGDFLEGFLRLRSIEWGGTYSPLNMIAESWPEPDWS
jgi:hypothetical protein